MSAIDQSEEREIEEQDGDLERQSQRIESAIKKAQHKKKVMTSS